MKTIQLGINGPKVSAPGLGTMGMSDLYGTKDSRNDAESIKTIQAALDMGIDFLDTGDYYGAGHNELLIREALKGLGKIRRVKCELTGNFSDCQIGCKYQFFGNVHQFSFINITRRFPKLFLDGIAQVCGMNMQKGCNIFYLKS